jgi:predicted short-subunit dehydrogenase-like oxidoreductase (DUF2520 family)
VCILGPGRLGRALHRRLNDCGHDTVLGRDPALAGGRDLVVVAVPDRAVAEVAAGLRDHPGRLAHCSGVLGLEALGRAQRVFALHPLATVPEDADPAAFDGAFAALTARDDADRRAGEQLAVALGLTPFALDDADRPLYHAAAALASNGLVTLLAAAADLWDRAGLDPALAPRALGPLAARAVANATAAGPARAITGPVARGDAATVAGHRAAIAAAAPELGPLYREVARATVDLLAPERRGVLEEALG